VTGAELVVLRVIDGNARVDRIVLRLPGSVELFPCRFAEVENDGHLDDERYGDAARAAAFFTTPAGIVAGIRWGRHARMWKIIEIIGTELPGDGGEVAIYGEQHTFEDHLVSIDVDRRRCWDEVVHKEVGPLRRRRESPPKDVIFPPPEGWRSGLSIRIREGPSVLGFGAALEIQ
jgi:hypothetical protein